ncbi:MAG: hypothetical protein AMXMBFR4_30530 [Candidatus Hydrogenedentota bacterium]
MLDQSNILIMLGVLLGASGLVLGVWMYVRDRKAREGAQRDPRNDFTHMMMLLQTMRDLLDQQKSLARDLNKALDQRVEFIKKTVDTARHEMTQIRESVHSLSLDLKALREQALRTREVAVTPRSQSEPAAASVPSNIEPFHPPEQTHDATKEADRPVLRVLAMPKEPAGGDVLDSWVGFDFAGDEPEPLSFEVPLEEPLEPSDPESAREAFRALLNMDQPRPEPGQTWKVGRKNASDEPGNGRPLVPPVHSRVYEYSDAGMSVTQIAQELGIGKGEVRLILSLRRRRTH